MGNWLTININRAPLILICLSVVLSSGFLVTRVSKRLSLPNVSGYIIAGVLIGPQVLGLVSSDFVMEMDFVSDIALAFIAFGVGMYFKKDIILNTGKKVFIITLFESLTAGVFIALTMKYIFHTSSIFALVIGAIATATAPASTVMTIKQYGAKGPFVDTLLQVVALDDVIALLAFGIASAVAQAAVNESVSVLHIVMPILFNFMSVGFGVVGAYILKRLIHEKRSKDNCLILAVSALLGISGICGILNVSPLLACMAMGAVYVNITGDEKLFKQLDSFSPPILSCFFVLSGMRLDISALKVSGIIGVAYFAIRIIGKYLGAYVGCKLAKTDNETKKYLGIALIPQAGVSIGLAFLGQRILPPEMGSLLATIILSSSILYELVGPISAKMSLVLAGAIQKEALKDEEKFSKEENP